MAIEHTESGTIITGEHIAAYRLMVAYSAATLDLNGVKLSGNKTRGAWLILATNEGVPLPRSRKQKDALWRRFMERFPHIAGGRRNDKK